MLNLITDPWIPVLRRVNGDVARDVIRPDQMAEADILFPDWPRADLNLACLELLIGLVYLADPPRDITDWKTRGASPDQLRAALAPLAPAFDLLGDGPRFLQDFDAIEGSENHTDFLFIDSAGGQTARQNKDLMVRRGRYPQLQPALAAMALYTLQAFAPSGGAGNRTSMRGGGPMVTLVRPDGGALWDLVWANVPVGVPVAPDELDELPWMRPTEVSDKGQVCPPPEGELPAVETFFGQPRRLRLTADASGAVTGVIQKTYGTNYQGWLHPLSPYYRIKAEMLPKHPKPGHFGYRNWRGIVLQGKEADRAATLSRFLKHRGGEPCRLLVAGWAMSNATPQDFLWSEAPVFALDDQGEMVAAQLVEAAEFAAFALAANTRDGTGETELLTGAAARAREAFFVQTQAPFEAALDAIMAGQGAAQPDLWLRQLRATALPLFDAQVLPGLAGLSETRRKQAVDARRLLTATFAGFGATGKKLFQALGMEPPGSVANFATSRTYPSDRNIYAASCFSSQAIVSAMKHGPTPKARSIMRF